MNQFDERSPYMSETTLNNVQVPFVYSNYAYIAYGIVILVIIGVIIYLYINGHKEMFTSGSKRSDPQTDEEYLEMQIDLLNRQQHKNMS